MVLRVQSILGILQVMKSTIELAVILELIILRITIPAILCHPLRRHHLLIIPSIGAVKILRVLVQDVAILIRHALTEVFGGRLRSMITVRIRLPYLPVLVLIRVSVRMIPLPEHVVALIDIGVMIQLLLKSQQILLVRVVKNLWLLVHVGWMHDWFDEQSRLLLYFEFIEIRVGVITARSSNINVILGFDSGVVFGVGVDQNGALTKAQSLALLAALRRPRLNLVFEAFLDALQL